MKIASCIICILTCLVLPLRAACEDLPAAGDILPEYSFPVPENAKDVAYLGLEGMETFKLSDVAAPYMVVEIVGVYCSQCRLQLTGFNKLIKRLRRADMSSKVKMLAIGAGATPEEVRYIRKADYRFPVVRDQDYAFHKMINEPQTPFTMLVSREGKVLYAHLGVIHDTDGFLEDIQRMTQ